MATTTEPYHYDLQFRGFIEGLTVKSKSSGTELCHYFGGLPYALPPVGPFRWRRPRPLPPCYRYGTRANPGCCTGKTSICPQPNSNSPLHDEDCLQVNIWVPSGTAPENGWPVYFYIHGGFLQMGNANAGNPTVLLSETPFKAIVVKPGYRLNIFGFLASQELLTDPSNTEKTVGNLGFWDIRLALEWTHKNISYFNGNPSNITVGGYSAGAHAAFYQLAYDLEFSPAKRIIKRVVMQSNGPGVQPKSLDEVQQQFDELLTALNIPLSIPAKEKVERLRALGTKKLLNVIPKMRLHQFRAITDGDFVRHSLFSDIVNGRFARQMRKSNVRILIGECSDEHFVYGRYFSPAESFDDVVVRLQADYPQKVSTALANHYFPGRKLPAKYRSWKEAFGKIYADVQIHATQRGFLDALIRCGVADLIQRYRIEWRSNLADRTTPRSWGATHGADQVLWFMGNGQRLDEKETEIARDGLIDQFAAFVMGETADWGTQNRLQVRRLTATGVVDAWQDEFWDNKLKVWKALMDVNLSIKASL